MNNGVRYPYLRVGNDRNNVRYLGYKIALSPCEYEIIKILYCSDEPLVKSEVARRAGGELGVSEKGVAVHICSVNKKIALFGGRRLVEFAIGKGYYLNPDM